MNGKCLHPDMDPSTPKQVTKRTLPSDEEEEEKDKVRYDLRSRKIQKVTETDATVRDGSEVKTGESLLQSYINIHGPDSVG